MSIFHLHPSRNNPLTYAPSSGLSYGSYFKNSKSKIISSIGIVYFLAKFCKTPVKKLCVKKKPDNQKDGGIPQSIHFWKNDNLVFKSIIYEPRGLSDGYDLPIHNYGTLPLNNALDAPYRAEFITILPNNANLISFNELLTILINPLNLCNY